jgi:hypothetical protein
VVVQGLVEWAGERLRSLAHHLDRHSRGEFPPPELDHLSAFYLRRFHGFHKPEILIGGGCAADSLKREIKTEIEGRIAGSGICVRIASSQESYGGDSPQNIVNRLTAGGESGIQIEQSLQARSSYWQEIADAVADVYDRKLGSCTID